MTENFTAFTHRATSREQLESYSRLDTDHVRLCGLISIARNYVIETSYRGFTIPWPRGQNSYTRVSCNLFLECRIILYRTQWITHGIFNITNFYIELLIDQKIIKRRRKKEKGVGNTVWAFFFKSTLDFQSDVYEYLFVRIKFYVENDS